MAPKKKAPGRPSLAPEDRKTERVVLWFTAHQARVLDALVEDDEDATSRNDLLRYLIREHYRYRLNHKTRPMEPVKRED